MVNLYTLEHCTANEYSISGTFLTSYTPSGTALEFEYNPNQPDIWGLPRSTTSITTMNRGTVNVDLGKDPGKKEIKLKVDLCTQAFFNSVANWYMNDEPDSLYLLTTHREDKFIVKWKDLSPRYLGTFPLSFSGTVPIPENMDESTPFYKYADYYELNMEFMYVDYIDNV